MQSDQIEELKALVEQASAPQEPATPVGNPVNRDKPELPAYLLAIIAIICIAALTFHGDKVPEVLNLVTIGALGIGGAVTTPGGKA